MSEQGNASITKSPVLGSILIASRDPDRLRGWYEQAFGLSADSDGFLRLGDVGMLVDRRDDIAATVTEPGRMIVNLHVDDARAVAHHLDAMGVRWLASLEYREASGAWFGTVLDVDGNYVQIIELTDAYRSAHRKRLRPPGRGPLVGAAVATRLPAQDLDRARAYYAEKLGLEPVETRPGGLRYECGAGAFSIFQSSGQASGEHTQMAWQVDDLDVVVSELRGRGVVFEEVNAPGMCTVDGIAEVDGNYPSDGGRGERAAWFRDSEGNLIGIGQPVGSSQSFGRQLQFDFTTGRRPN